MTTTILYLIDYKDRSFQEIGITSNFTGDNYTETLRPYCDQYSEELKVGKLIFLTTENDGDLQAQYRASYGDWIEEHEDYPYYFDVAEHDERVMFECIIKGIDWITFGNNKKQSNVVNINEALLSRQVKELTQDRDDYKVAFEFVMRYIHDWSHDHNDGSLLLGLPVDASDLGEENIDAFMLIENWTNLDDVTKEPKEYEYLLN